MCESVEGIRLKKGDSTSRKWFWYYLASSLGGGVLGAILCLYGHVIVDGRPIVITLGCAAGLACANAVRLRIPTAKSE